MSVDEWIDSRVPGGLASKFGQVLRVAYTIEYGADAGVQSALNRDLPAGLRRHAEEVLDVRRVGRVSRVDRAAAARCRRAARGLGQQVQFFRLAAATTLSGRTQLASTRPAERWRSWPTA
jgi:hypothetical protein